MNLKIKINFKIIKLNDFYFIMIEKGNVNFIIYNLNYNILKIY